MDQKIAEQEQQLISAQPARTESLSLTIAKYASSRILGQLFGIITTFARPNLITPAQFGLWNLLKTFPLYVSHVHLGTMTSMRFLIPYYHAAGEHERAERMKNTVYTLALLLNTIVALAFCVAPFLAIPYFMNYSHEKQIGLACVAALILLQFFNEFMTVILRSNEQFNILSLNNILRSIVTCILTLLFMSLWGLYGLYFSAILIQAIVVGHLWFSFNAGVKLQFDTKAFKELFHKGLPMHLSDIAMLVFTTTPQIVIWRCFPGRSWEKELGFYSIALIFTNFLQHLPGTAREIMEPRMMRHLAHSAGADVVEAYLLKPFVNTAYLLPILLAPALLTIPTFVPLVLSKYIPGINPTLILIFGFYFLALCEQPNAMMLAMNWQHRLLWSLLLAIGLNFTLSFLFIKNGLGITGVAWASSISYFSLFIMYLLLLGFSLKDKGHAWWTNLLALCIPLPVMAGLVLLLRYCVPLLVPHPVAASAVQVILIMPAMVFMHRTACRYLPLLKPINIGKFMPRRKVMRDA